MSPPLRHQQPLHEVGREAPQRRSVLGAAEVEEEVQTSQTGPRVGWFSLGLLLGFLLGVFLFLRILWDFLGFLVGLGVFFVFFRRSLWDFLGGLGWFRYVLVVKSA